MLETFGTRVATISRSKENGYFDDSELLKSFFKQKMSNFCWFQLFKCGYLPFFLLFAIMNVESFGLCTLAGHMKQLERRLFGP